MRDDIVLSYIKAYIEVAKAEEMYLLSQKKLVEYKKLYQKELTKNQSGLSSLSFVSNIRGKFRSTQIEVFEKQRILSDKIAQIGQYYRIDENERYYFPNMIKKLPNDIDSAIETMIKNSHKLKKITHEINISQTKYRNSYKNILPSVTLVAKKTWANNYYNDPSTLIEKSYLGIEANISLFSGFKDWNSYIAGIENYNSKIQDKDRILIESIYKLKLKYNQLKLEESKDELIKYFIKARFDALTGAKYDFEFGKIDISIFLNSINEFYGSREKYINHRYDELLNKYEFSILLGIFNYKIKSKDNIINEEIVLDDERFFSKSDISTKLDLKKNKTYIVKKSKTNIYSSNSKNSKIIDTLGQYDEIVSIKISGKWIKCKKGWVYSRDIIDKYLKNRRYIATVNINVRKKALLKSKVIGWYKKGDEIFSSDYKEGWVKTHKGWVYGGNLRVDIKANEYYIVNATTLSIREKPNLKSHIVGRYNDMSEVYALQEKDGWIETSKGWVNKKYLIKIQEK
jgi:uncharacterized protein YgiM (DUF1202 family)